MNSPGRIKRLYSEVVELAAHKSATFYECSMCADKVYTFVENGVRMCFRCKFNASPPYRCGFCLLGCYNCKK